MYGGQRLHICNGTPHQDSITLVVVLIPTISQIIIEVEGEATMLEAEAEVHLQVSSNSVHHNLTVLILEQTGQFAKSVVKQVI